MIIGLVALAALKVASSPEQGSSHSQLFREPQAEQLIALASAKFAEPIVRDWTVTADRRAVAVRSGSSLVGGYELDAEGRVTSLRIFSPKCAPHKDGEQFIEAALKIVNPGASQVEVAKVRNIARNNWGGLKSHFSVSIGPYNWKPFTAGETGCSWNILQLIEAPPPPPRPPRPPKSVNRLLANITIDDPGVAKTIVLVREGGLEGDTMIMFLGRRDKVGQEPGWPHFVDAADCPAALAIYQNKDQVVAESAKYLTNVSPGSAAVKGPTYLVEFDDEGSKPKRIGPHGLDAPAGQWIKKLVQILEGCWIPAIVSMEKG